MPTHKKPRVANRKPSDDGDEPTPDPNPPIPVPAGGPFVSSLTIDPFVVTGAGGSLYYQATGTITLNAPAPAGGAIVNISFSHPDLVRVWNAVLPLKAPKGKTKIKFFLETSAVSTLTTVEISANRSPFDIHKATLYILPAALNYLAVDHYFYHGEGGPIYGGERILIVAVLTGPTAIPYSVALHSSNNSVLNLQGMQVDFSPGEYEKNLIVPTSLITQETQVVITATFPSPLGGGTASASTSVQLVPLFLKGIHKQRVQAIGGEVIETSGHKYKWKLWLNGRAPVGGAVVMLQSSDPTLLVADPSITIPEGSTDGHFHIWTDQSQYGGGQCGNGCYVHISATYVHTVTRRFKIYDP